MKKRFVVVTGALLLISSLATAEAAPVSSAKGIQNSKKVMQHYKERYQAVQKSKQKARGQRNAQRQQRAAAPPSAS
jgi:Skp family chaperone for outer membrane proteins